MNDCSSELLLERHDHVYDRRMIYESGWLEWLKAVELHGDWYYFFFGDACFAANKYLQVAKVYVLYGGYIAEDAKELNALLSRIRIRIEERKFSSWEERMLVFKWRIFTWVN